MSEMKVLNPVDKVLGEVSATPMATRPSSLEGETIGLAWNGKANGDVALKKAGEVLQNMVPSAKIKFYGGALPTPPFIMDNAIEEVPLCCRR